MGAVAMRDVADMTLQHEHVALLRYLGRLQQGMSVALCRLEGENLRLRAELVLTRTAWLWGLAPGAAARVPQQSTPRDGRIVAAPSVSDVLCQVSCEGHAHPWLDGDGQCRLRGESCERLVAGEGRR